MFSSWLPRASLPATGLLRTLPDGLQVLVRPVVPEDAPRFIAGYERLSEQSRRLRFFGQVSGISSRQLEFLSRPDGRNHLAWAALNAEAPDEPGVAVARCIRLDADSRIAEVAITVIDEYQNRGVGLLLHACLHRAAHPAGIRQFIYDVSAENSRFIQHLLALGARQVSRDHQVVRLMLPVFRNARAVPAGSPSAERMKLLMSQLR